ncbi:MAG: NitT/TauT family transport system substrate-binding protein [Saprospiraceae bacterium]|jgi:NitT/TauT family transport system substrate-binding protein
MAKTQLTMFSKLLITILIVGLLVFGGYYLLNKTSLGQDLKKQSQAELVNANNGNSNTANNNASSGSDDEVVKIGVVTWGGYAGGQYFNEGFEASTASRFYKDYGIKVEFKVLDDFEASRNAFRADEVNLLWQTIDAFPTEVNGLGDFDPVVVWQADWSRGGDAVVARRGITSVADLRGKKIAVAELTPSHSFLIWLLEAGGLTVNDVEIVPQASALDAAEVFKSQRVDAAVVWSPDDILSLKAVPGSRILESTKSAAYIIADVFMAKRAYVQRNEDKIRKIYEGWMKGAAEINSNPQARKKAAAILAREFTERGTALTDAEADEMIGNVHLTTHGDNQNFFGLNPNFKGVTGNDLYSEMGIKYTELGYIEEHVPNWRMISFPKLVTSTDLSGAMHNAEGAKAFSQATESDKTKEAIATKRVSITFRTAEYQLDENAKYIIDKEFVGIAKAFGNARIRVEGNTDNTGNYNSNVALSQRRAQSVIDYLVQEYNMPRNRFIVKGNGPNNPIASNDSDTGRAQNRRTDFELVAD